MLKGYLPGSLFSNYPFVLCLLFFFLNVLSCSKDIPVDIQVPAVVRQGAYPSAILQPGGQPLWFQLTENGPVLLYSIEDAVFSAALVPWPLALYVCFFREHEDGLVIVINRDGFIKIAPNEEISEGLAMYRFSADTFWRQYTVGGFVHYDDKPAALLYLNDRFLDSDAPLPLPRIWSINMESNIPFSLDIPALRLFPAEEGWDVDAIRLGSDNYFYYRAVKRRGASPEIRMLRTDDLSQAGEEISQDVFYNSVPRETEISLPSLPLLPEGFVYTGIGRVGDCLFVFWEEQENFYIGAAGFMVIKP